MIAGTQINVAAEIEWTRDVNGRALVMKRIDLGYLATLHGFSGVGTSQEAALDALLAQMQNYAVVSMDLTQSLAPGGALDQKLQQIRQLVDTIVVQRSDPQAALVCPHCRASEPSVWDDVLFHYAHPDPASDKLKFCHAPWRERCRCCSRDPDHCVRSSTVEASE